jgi:predicted GNAT family acetyltransferase
MSDIQVVDAPERHRFDLLVDGEHAGLADYQVRGDRVTVVHSEVDPAFRGQGLGHELARQTLDQLRARGAQVVPACPFFAAYVREHHEWDDILAS